MGKQSPTKDFLSVIGKKIISICLLVPACAGFFCLPVLAQTERPSTEEPDSEYVEKTQRADREESGGLLDFLPFIGGPQKKITPEKLLPSPKPEQSKPVFSKRKMEELQMTAGMWLLSSEFTEPTVRQDRDGRYYRDYVVFAEEYEAEVVRGNSEDTPFVGHIFIKGDYFRTKSHDMADAARSDYKFGYQSLEFRVVFNRMEKWEYSDNPDREPFIYTERWEFHNLQSRIALDFSKRGLLSGPTAASGGDVEPPVPETSAEE